MIGFASRGKVSGVKAAWIRPPLQKEKKSCATRKKRGRRSKGETKEKKEMGNARSTMTSMVSVIELSQSERRADKCEKKGGAGAQYHFPPCPTTQAYRPR